MSKLLITNTLTKQKNIFQPLQTNKVLMYVCGITPYDFAHVGHGRVYVTFDILYRLLKFLDYEVIYCRNFTDIDDKLLKRATQELSDPMRYPEIAQKFISAFHQDMHDLQCLPPDYEPHVTKTIPQIIGLIQKLIQNGKAYVANGSVYYDVASFTDYGKLSKQNLAELNTGARVAVEAEKNNPLDFALWKAEPQNQFWPSPWGWGRPGWHIECSAMATTYLGEQIDIHGGGQDLIFPHHENEIAQSEGVYPAPFAKYWMHNAFVRINQEKMSKSLSNFFTLNDIFKQFDPMVLRYYFIMHNYNTPLDFNLDELTKVQKSYQRLCLALEKVELRALEHTEWPRSQIINKIMLYLCDDLNTSGALGVIFENLPKLKETDKAMLKAFLQQIFGLKMAPLAEKITITPEIAELIAKRDAARAAKDWKTADSLRADLLKLGIPVHDK